MLYDNGSRTPHKFMGFEGRSVLVRSWNETNCLQTFPERKIGSMVAGHETLSRRLADTLCREIRKHRLAPGASLGTEAELAERFGVSRTVVREAIGTLRGVGVVTSRQGCGLRVAAGNPRDTLSKAFAPLAARRESWSEICQLRFVLELGSVALAVERASTAQINRMRTLAKAMLKLVRKRRLSPKTARKSLNELELKFHQLVFEAAGGRLTGEFHGVLVEYFQQEYGHGPHNQAATLQSMREHLALVDAIESRDASQAVAILAEHLRSILVSDPSHQQATAQKLV